jgi:hypothetical protein
MDIACPHCAATNPEGSAFCQTCGKALPAAAPTGPRVLTGDAMPQSAAGQQLMGDELTKQTKRAANCLLVVAILMLVFAAILGAIAAAAPRGLPRVVLMGLLIQAIIGVVFLGLYAWARTAPLPASIVGLCIYATLVVVNVVNAMSNVTQEQQPGGFRGLGVSCIDIIIIAILAQGIQAGLKHRRLMAESSAM